MPPLLHAQYKEMANAFAPDYRLIYFAIFDKPYLGRIPLKDQDECEMCWAIATSDVVAMALSILHPEHKIVLISSNDILNCANFEKWGATHCYPFHLQAAFSYMTIEGVLKEDEDNYFRTMKSDCVDKTPEQEQELVRIAGYEELNHNDEWAMMNAVRECPIVVGIKWTEELAVLKKKRYLKDQKNFILDKDGKIVQHAVVIVGYGYHLKDFTRFWVIKNSQGPNWGHYGFGCIARESSMEDGEENLLVTAMRPVLETHELELEGRKRGKWYKLGTKIIYKH